MILRARLHARPVLLFWALAMAALLPGCGEGTDRPATSSASSEAASEPGADELETLIVGVGPSFPPFEMKAEDGVTPIGFDIDLFQAIAEDQGYAPAFVDVAFEDLIPHLQAGEIDVALAGMSITPERRADVDFTEPYFNAGLVIATRPGSGVDSLRHLSDKTIGVQAGTTGSAAAEAFHSEGKIGDVRGFDDTDAMMAALLAGEIEAVINDRPSSLSYARQSVGTMYVLPEVLVADDYGLAVRKGNRELLRRLNAGVRNLQATGALAKIEARWFGESSAPAPAPAP